MPVVDKNWAHDCESPIERLLGFGMVFCCGDIDGDSFVHLHRRAEPPYECEHGIAIWPQAKIGRYRVDFLIIFAHRDLEPVRMVIECDGHDYHERTPEQAARDRKRDREMMKQGYYVVRFTGSEIHRNPVECIQEILGLFESMPAVRKGQAYGAHQNH